jgi:hypothetical protein
MGQILPMLEDCERIMLQAQRFAIEEAINDYLPEDVRAALEDQRLRFEEAQTELRSAKLNLSMSHIRIAELENELRASEETAQVNAMLSSPLAALTGTQMAILQRDRFRSNFYRAKEELNRVHGNKRSDGVWKSFQQSYRPRPLKRTLNPQRRFFAERMSQRHSIKE